MRWAADDRLNDFIQNEIGTKECAKPGCKKGASCIGKPSESSGKLVFECGGGHRHTEHWKDATDVRDRSAKVAQLERRVASAESDSGVPHMLLEVADEVMLEHKAARTIRGHG